RYALRAGVASVRPISAAYAATWRARYLRAVAAARSRGRSPRHASGANPTTRRDALAVCRAFAPHSSIRISRVSRYSDCVRGLCSSGWAASTGLLAAQSIDEKLSPSRRIHMGVCSRRSAVGRNGTGAGAGETELRQTAVHEGWEPADGGHSLQGAGGFSRFPRRTRDAIQAGG